MQCMLDGGWGTGWGRGGGGGGGRSIKRIVLWPLIMKKKLKLYEL